MKSYTRIRNIPTQKRCSLLYPFLIQRSRKNASFLREMCLVRSTHPRAVISIRVACTKRRFVRKSSLSSKTLEEDTGLPAIFGRHGKGRPIGSIWSQQYTDGSLFTKSIAPVTMVLSSCLAVYIPSVYSLSGYSRSHIQVYYAWYAAAYVGMRIGFGEE